MFLLVCYYSDDFTQLNIKNCLVIYLRVLFNHLVIIIRCLCHCCGPVLLLILIVQMPDQKSSGSHIQKAAEINFITLS